MRSIIRSQTGVTLVELLVAMAITGIVGVFMLKVFQSNSYLFSGERKVTATYQNARNIAGRFSHQVREMGYNPTDTDNSDYTFGLKDSTGNFTTNAVTSDTSIFWTSDYDADGTIDNNGTERIGWRLNGTDLEVANIDPVSGTVSGWTAKYNNVTAFKIVYTYGDGSGSSGTADLPNNTVSGKTYGDVRMVSLYQLDVRSETEHDLTKQFVTESDACPDIVLRNNLRPQS